MADGTRHWGVSRIEQVKDRRNGYDIATADPQYLDGELACPGQFVGLGPADTQDRTHRLDVGCHAQRTYGLLSPDH
jgi:hypothetical protein